jgi:2-(1,2-epoxy-1,2-dihydrophenyl)acetyl-CoA isomerase
VARDQGGSTVTASVTRTGTEGAIATITMNRPALTRVTRRELMTAVHVASAEPSVRVIVLTGTGTVFCAGQDLAEHAEALERDPATAVDSLRDEYRPLIGAIAGAPKPVIAAVNGACAGGGLGLALACDLRIARDDARFTPAFAAIGLAPDCGVSATLARAVGGARAREILLLSRPFTGADALRWGLVSAAVDATAFAATVTETAEALTQAPAAALAATRQLLDAAAESLDEALWREYEQQCELAQTHQHRRAVQAFLARRTRNGGRR